MRSHRAEIFCPPEAGPVEATLEFGVLRREEFDRYRFRDHRKVRMRIRYALNSRAPYVMVISDQDARHGTFCTFQRRQNRMITDFASMEI